MDCANKKHPDIETYNFLVVVLAVTAVLDVVLVVARLFTQKAGQLGARHVEALFTALPVAVHARARRRLARAAGALANVARLERQSKVKISSRKSGQSSRKSGQY